MPEQIAAAGLREPWPTVIATAREEAEMIRAILALEALPRELEEERRS
jgi:hypothetical protein